MTCFGGYAPPKQESKTRKKETEDPGNRESHMDQGNGNFQDGSCAEAEKAITLNLLTTQV